MYFKLIVMNTPFISCLNKQASIFFKVKVVVVKIYKKNIPRVLSYKIFAMKLMMNRKMS